MTRMNFFIPIYEIDLILVQLNKDDSNKDISILFKNDGEDKEVNEGH